MRYTALLLGALMTASVTARAQTPDAKAPAFEDHYADVNGVRLHYACVGSGPLVLFLHGYPRLGGQPGLGVRDVSPEMLDKLIIVNGAHTFTSERELRENPAQRYASNYFFVFNGYLAPGEQPVDESTTKETATRRAHSGFVEADPASTIPHSWSAKEMTAGVKSTIITLPTLVIWGMKDTAILPGNLTRLDAWVENLSVKLYPDDDHWVMLEKNKAVAQDIRQFIDGRDFPKESVYRAGAR
jgi:pimeloyl-ACP methyl ester carboxylesterase